MIDLCRKCFELNCVGSFFCDNTRPDTYLAGYIEAYNEKEILIKHISPDGFYDGFILVHIPDIVRVNILGKYEKRIATLYSIRKQSHPVLNYLNNTLYLSIMDFALANNLVASIELENTTISGFVLDFDECNLHMEVINENGETDGETIVSVENILSFAIDTITEQNLKLLNTAINKGESFEGAQGTVLCADEAEDSLD